MAHKQQRQPGRAGAETPLVTHIVADVGNASQLLAQVNREAVGAADDKAADRTSSASSQQWKKDDAEWFRSNPLREFRLRSAFPGECPGHPEVNQVLVRQIAPGKRTKMMGVAKGDGTSLTEMDLLIMWFALLNCSEGTTRIQLFSPPGEGAR